MIRGIDCASRLTREKASALYSLGYRFAGRYVVPTVGSTAWKALTLPEAEAIRASGMDILCIFELDAARAGRGEAVGAQDGDLAQSCARALGIPAGTTLYFAVDYYPAAAEMPQIEAYLRAAGARIAPYTLGVYGCYDVVEYLAARHVCRHYWQCVGWSGGKISANADLYQATGNVNVAGVLVDQNERYREAGLWKSADAPDTGASGGNANNGNASGNTSTGTATNTGASPSGGNSGNTSGGNASNHTGGANADASSPAAGGNSASANENPPAADALSGEEIYNRLQAYCLAQPLPAWAEAEYAEAVARGLTDGENPMLFAPRYQAAILALRALRAAEGKEEKT